jgi:hypothetical protein
MNFDTLVQTTSTFYTCVSPLSHGSYLFYQKQGNVKDVVVHLKAHDMRL